MSENLNGVIDTRGFFERILKEFKETLTERNLRLDERFAAQEKAINKADGRLDSVLKGFPDEYSRKIEVERLRENLATMANVLADKVTETSGLLSAKVTDTATALAVAQDKVTDQHEARLSKLEGFQAKVLGLALAAPFVTGLGVYLLTRH